MTSPQIIAHRGAWKENDLPQNSLAALQRAKDIGCSNVELDVHLTADEVVVVNHDHDFYGIPIESSTYMELCKTQHPNGENIPQLGDFLALAKDLDIQLSLEIKASEVSVERSLQLTEKTLALVKEADMAQKTHYISFDAEVMQKVLLLEPSATASYLKGDLEPAQIAARGWQGIDYHQLILRANPQWIKQARERELWTNVWTVNDAGNMQWFLQSGIDFITTDKPQQLLEMQKASSQQ